MTTLRTLRGLAVLGLASLAFSNSAQAQTLPVDVDITIGGGGITILNYYSAIDVTINSADLAALQNASFCAPTSGVSNCSAGTVAAGTASSTAGVSGGNLRANGNLTLAAAANNLSAVTLDLDNVWAVRAIGGSTANTTVAILVGGDTALDNGSDSIEIVDADVYRMSNGTAGASVTFADPGLVTPVFGGVKLTLDFSNADIAGTYSSGSAAADENYLIGITGT